MGVPQYRNRSPEEIVNAKRLFDSAWHFWQALSWLDHAKRTSSVSALQFAALELRTGTELLWFEIIVTAVGGDLDIEEYARCKGDATKMYKILERLSPDHTKLVRFTGIAMLVAGHQLPAEWDMTRLKRLYGEISQFLHFLGIPAETVDDPKWFDGAVTLIETGASYVWGQVKAGPTGQLKVASMPPEVRDAWEGFRTGVLTEDSVKARLRIAEPILRQRMGGL